MTQEESNEWNDLKNNYPLRMTTLTSLWLDTVEYARYMHVQAQIKIDQLFTQSMSPFFTQLATIMHPDDYNNFQAMMILNQARKEASGGDLFFLYRGLVAFACLEGASYLVFQRHVKAFIDDETVPWPTKLTRSQYLAVLMRRTLCSTLSREETAFMPSFLPSLLIAWFVAEAVRNPITIISTLMLLDLIQSGQVLRIDADHINLYEWQYAFIHPLKYHAVKSIKHVASLCAGEHQLPIIEGCFGGVHPMAHGGSIGQNQRKLENNVPLTIVRQKEGSLLLHWLQKCWLRLSELRLSELRLSG